MIRGIHALFYSSAADELRACLRDIFSLPTSDVGGGWLIFDVAEAEIGVHPADESQMHARSGTHAISLYCDDIHTTVEELKAKGVEFIDEIADQGFGLVTRFRLPGGVEVDLYQPFFKKDPAQRPEVAGPLAQKSPTPPPPPAPSAAPQRKRSPRKAKTAQRKKAAAKKAAAEKAPAKKPVTRGSTKKSAAKKSTTKKSATKKSNAKKVSKKKAQKPARRRGRT